MTALTVLQESEPLFTQALTVQELSWPQEYQFAMQALQKNDYLSQIAAQAPHSLQNAVINIAAIGISLNPALKHAYLVPRDGQVSLDISYMGLLHLAMESKAIIFGQARLVREADTYVNAGIDKAPMHTANTFGDRGEVVGVYCTVKLATGDFITEEMTREELNKVKAASKSAAKGKGPWMSWPEEMMRKTVVKRASKYWPHTDRLGTATNYLNDVEGNVQEIVVEGESTEFYPEERFAENFSAWSDLVASGARQPEDIIAIISSKHELTEVQIQAITSLGEQDVTE